MSATSRKPWKMRSARNPSTVSRCAGFRRARASRWRSRRAGLRPARSLLAAGDRAVDRVDDALNLNKFDPGALRLVAIKGRGEDLRMGIAVLDHAFARLLQRILPLTHVGLQWVRDRPYFEMMVTAHRGVGPVLSSMTDRTRPRTVTPPTCRVAGIPLNWAKRQRRASVSSAVSIVCTAHLWVFRGKESLHLVSR